MAFIGQSRPDWNRPWDMYVCLNISECKTFLSVVEKLLVKAQKRYNHYRDVMDGGEATTRQQTLYMEAEENLEHLESIKDSMKNFIRDYQKK